MEERYKEVSLNKIRLIPICKKLELIPQASEFYKVFGYESKNIGWFYNLKEAEEALQKHSEKDSDIFAFEIIGPEHGFGKSDFVLNEEDDLYDEIKEDEKYDESPEYKLLYDSQKKLLSSYFYDKKNPGGKRLKGEKILKKGDLAYVRVSIYIEDENYDILIPVVIEGEVSKEFLENKWRNAIKDRNKLFYDIDQEPSEEMIQYEIGKRLNIERDSLIFKPLVTVKCNWGEEPQTPIDDRSRIDFFVLNIQVIKSL